MASERQQRRDELARERGFANYYEQRKFAAQAAGYESLRQQQTARAAARQGDTSRLRGGDQPGGRRSRPRAVQTPAGDVYRPAPLADVQAVLAGAGPGDRVSLTVSMPDGRTFDLFQRGGVSVPAARAGIAAAGGIGPWIAGQAAAQLYLDGSDPGGDADDFATLAALGEAEVSMSVW